MFNLCCILIFFGREFVAQCFHPFSAALCKEGVYREVEKEAQDLLATLRDQVER